jgi:hypothetical protein
VASWGWLQSPFFIVCLNQGHFFFKSFFINFYDFFKILFFKISWGERKSGVASGDLLQSPFFLVCLNQGHFFSKSFSSIFMIFFGFKKIIFFKISWGERKSGVASWGWLQSPFFIVYFNQGHFFLSLFS